MRPPLLPCPSCNRHVFADACACPFCSAKLAPESCAARGAPPAGHSRLGRAARIAAGATLMGAAGCSSTTTISHYGAPPYVAPDAAQDAAEHSSTDGRGGQGAGGSGGEGGAGGQTGRADQGALNVPIHAAPVSGKGPHG